MKERRNMRYRGTIKVKGEKVRGKRKKEKRY
jgi:hypothetical protein